MCFIIFSSQEGPIESFGVRLNREGARQEGTASCEGFSGTSGDVAGWESPGSSPRSLPRVAHMSHDGSGSQPSGRFATSRPPVPSPHGQRDPVATSSSNIKDARNAAPAAPVPFPGPSTDPDAGRISGSPVTRPYTPPAAASTATARGAVQSDDAEPAGTRNGRHAGPVPRGMHHNSSQPTMNLAQDASGMAALSHDEAEAAAEAAMQFTLHQLSRSDSVPEWVPRFTQGDTIDLPRQLPPRMSLCSEVWRALVDCTALPLRCRVSGVAIQRGSHLLGGAHANHGAHGCPTETVTR